MRESEGALGSVREREGAQGKQTRERMEKETMELEENESLREGK